MERVRRAEELGGRGWEGGPVWQPEAIRWMVPDGPCFPSEPGTCHSQGKASASAFEATSRVFRTTYDPVSAV